MLAIIIPTLNAASALPAALSALADHAGLLVVVDGGSQDETMTVAARAGATVLMAPAGRGGQLATGATWALAHGAEWLLFLHADCRLPSQWQALVANHQRMAPQAAAYFRLRFETEHPAARRVEALAMLRCRWLGLPYGDQGLLCPKGLYQAVGGYDQALPLMEDVDLARRLGRRRLRLLPAAVATSAERYQRGGWWGRPLKNLSCLALYWLGVAPETIVRWYRR